VSDPTVCPYCRMPFDASSPPRIFCTACGTPQHEDCYSENGGCTIFGRARAPAEEPKLQVSHNDLKAATVARPAATTVAARPYASPIPAGAAPSLGRVPPAGEAAPSMNLGYATAPNLGYAQSASAPVRSPKNRTAYIVLGVFLGALGVHNFYAGYTARAVSQVCLSIFTLPFVPFLAMVSWAWAIVEICIVDKDSNGLQFS